LTSSLSRGSGSAVWGPRLSLFLAHSWKLRLPDCVTRLNVDTPVYRIRNDLNGKGWGNRSRIFKLL
jgi:hypothetical protein